MFRHSLGCGCCGGGGTISCVTCGAILLPATLYVTDLGDVKATVSGTTCIKETITDAPMVWDSGLAEWRFEASYNHPTCFATPSTFTYRYRLKCLSATTFQVIKTGIVCCACVSGSTPVTPSQQSVTINVTSFSCSPLLITHSGTSGTTCPVAPPMMATDLTIHA